MPRFSISESQKSANFLGSQFTLFQSIKFPFWNYVNDKVYFSKVISLKQLKLRMPEATYEKQQQQLNYWLDAC
jgi:hypothetical protein